MCEALLLQGDTWQLVMRCSALQLRQLGTRFTKIMQPRGSPRGRRVLLGGFREREREREGEVEISEKDQGRVKSLKKQAWGVNKCMESALEEGQQKKRAAVRAARERKSHLLEAKAVLGVAETQRCHVEALMVMRESEVKRMMEIDGKVRRERAANALQLSRSMQAAV